MRLGTKPGDVESDRYKAMKPAPAQRVGSGGRRVNGSSSGSMFMRSGDVMRRARAASGGMGSAMAKAVGSSMRGGDGRAPWAIVEDAGGLGRGRASVSQFGAEVSAQYGRGGSLGSKTRGPPAGPRAMAPPSLMARAWNRFPLIRVQPGGRCVIIIQQQLPLPQGVVSVINYRSTGSSTNTPYMNT